MSLHFFSFNKTPETQGKVVQSKAADIVLLSLPGETSMLSCLAVIIGVINNSCVNNVEFTFLQLFWLKFLWPFISYFKIGGIAVPLQKEKPKQNLFNGFFSFLFKTGKKKFFSLLENEIQNFFLPKEAAKVSFTHKWKVV